MTETYVRLLCPDCSKEWESTPMDLPSHKRSYDCPGCQTSRRLAEFTRTEHDLETLKTLQ
jgi:DNA-directed RNA polymerase subunit RPC12/RpoP